MGYDGGMATTAIPTAEQPSPPPADRVRIVSTPGTCGGRPRIDGHRITVEDVAIWHERQGMSPDEIVNHIPSTTLSDVHYALAYYFDHIAEIQEEMRADRAFVEDFRRSIQGN